MTSESHALTLYAGPLSMFSGKVRVALREKGIAHHEESVPFTFAGGYSPKHPSVLQHNPKLQVPVLRVGDVYLYDSTLILEYLEDAYPNPSLYPVSPIDKAVCRQLELEADEVFFPHVARLIRARYFGEPLSASEHGVVLGRLHALYDRLDERLKDRAFLLHDFTAADIAYAMVIRFATFNGARFAAEHASVGAWFERCGMRPSIAAEFSGLAKSAQRLSQ